MQINAMQRPLAFPAGLFIVSLARLIKSDKPEFPAIELARLLLEFDPGHAVASRCDLGIARKNLAAALVLGGFARHPLHAVVAAFGAARRVLILERTTQSVVLGSQALTGEKYKRSSNSGASGGFEPYTTGILHVNLLKEREIGPVGHREMISARKSDSTR